MSHVQRWQAHSSSLSSQYSAHAPFSGLQLSRDAHVAELELLIEQEQRKNASLPSGGISRQELLSLLLLLLLLLLQGSRSGGAEKIRKNIINQTRQQRKRNTSKGRSITQTFQRN